MAGGSPPAQHHTTIRRACMQQNRCAQQRVTTANPHACCCMCDARYGHAALHVGKVAMQAAAACALPEQCAGRTLKGAVHHGPRPARAQSRCQLLTPLHYREGNRLASSAFNKGVLKCRLMALARWNRPMELTSS